MRTPIKTPPEFYERNELSSGAIEKGGFSRRGVIFTVAQSTSPADFDLSILEGAEIENIDLRGKEDNRFFKVLGGYYCDRSGGNLNISQLFGIATDSSQGFNLQAGASCLADEWKLMGHGSQEGQDLINERTTGSSGWTFIVEFKPLAHLYPLNCRELAIFSVCPEIGNLQAGTVLLADKTQEIEVEAILSEGTAIVYDWDWGDGSPLEQTSSGTHRHTYNRQAGNDTSLTVKVTAHGTDSSCQSDASTDVTVCGVCPVVNLQQVDVQYPSTTQASVTVNLQVGDLKPDRYQWDWGDGSPIETTTAPTATHAYPREAAQDKTYQISVHSEGPDSCHANVSTSVEIEHPCPLMVGLEHLSAADKLTDQHLEVTLKANVKDGTPERYRWDWGDGSAPEFTQTAEATHSYPRPGGDETQFKVTCTLEGPGANCSDSGSMDVAVPGACPKFQRPAGIVHYIRVEPNEVEVEVELFLFGPTPEKIVWQWGQEETIEADGKLKTQRRTFTRPDGDRIMVPLHLTAKGPGGCEDKSGVAIPIPGRCAEFIGIKLEVGSPVDHQYEVKALARTTDPAPETYTWDWGDGSAPEVTTTPSATHTYPGKFGEGQSFELSVTAKGPDNCEAKTERPVEIPALPCPVISQFSYELGEKTADTQSVTFKVALSSGGTTQFSWDFGDGSPIVQTDTGEVTHVYKNSYEAHQDFAAKVSYSGPGVCEGSRIVKVEIPICCPVMGAMSLEEIRSEDKELEVRAKVAMGPGAAQTYTWNWGDGSAPETTDVPEATHVYKRSWGDGDRYEIRVDSSGPESCKANNSISLPVGGCCPVPGALTVEKDSEDRTTHTVVAKLEVLDGSPKAYHWDPGDGSPIVTTTTPSLKHTYAKLLDEAQMYLFQVHMAGPGSCSASRQQEVEVPATPECPVLQEVYVEEALIPAQDPGLVTFGFSPVVSGGNITHWDWDWGDGTQDLGLSQAKAYHTYKRPGKGEAPVPYKVTLSTPEGAACPIKGTADVTVDPARVVIPDCPDILGIKEVSKKNLDGRRTEVMFEVEFSGVKPDRFVWDAYGDHPSVTRTEPKVTLVFDRPEVTTKCPIGVTTHGPNNCDGRATGFVEIEGAEQASLMCRLITYILAFLGAMTLGTVLVAIARLTLEGENGDGVLLISAISATLFFTGIVAWYVFGKRMGCPPEVCGWLGIGWVTFLAGFMVTLLMTQCLEMWIPMAVVFFLLGALLVVLWFRRCGPRPEPMKLYGYVILCFLAAAICYFLVAQPLLNCC
ncbi:MAG: PKD domain-containing protein [Bacteroidota bacterium]